MEENSESTAYVLLGIIGLLFRIIFKLIYREKNEHKGSSHTCQKKHMKRTLEVQCQKSQPSKEIASENTPDEPHTLVGSHGRRRELAGIFSRKRQLMETLLENGR